MRLVRPEGVPHPWPTSDWAPRITHVEPLCARGCRHSCVRTFITTVSNPAWPVCASFRASRALSLQTKYWKGLHMVGDQGSPNFLLSDWAVPPSQNAGQIHIVCSAKLVRFSSLLPHTHAHTRTHAHKPEPWVDSIIQKRHWMQRDRFYVQLLLGWRRQWFGNAVVCKVSRVKFDTIRMFLLCDWVEVLRGGAQLGRDVM